MQYTAPPPPYLLVLMSQKSSFNNLWISSSSNIHKYLHNAVNHSPILDRIGSIQFITESRNIFCFGSVQTRLPPPHLSPAASVMTASPELIIRLGIKLVSSLGTSQSA